MKTLRTYLILGFGACLGCCYRLALESGGPNGPYSTVVVAYVSFAAFLFFVTTPFRTAFLGLLAFWIAVLLAVSIPRASMPFGGEMHFFDKLLLGLFFTITGCVISMPAILIGWGVRHLFSNSSNQKDGDR
jgi:hypothetical protein